MSYGRALQITRILGLLLAGLYTIAAIAVLLADRSHGQTVLGIALLGGGAVLVLVGQNLTRISPVLSAAVVSLGAAVGAFPLFPLILPPIAATALIVMSFAVARQPTPAP
jgi:hypothetical protein